ncbi:MAG TPA: hypothetical protein VNL91_11360 [Thermoanaerobaculia bacterium]|nr:hypothetical protein [Thermoanaerobaculia bacterium]
MTAKVVWIIDAQQWPRALLRAELIERGFDAVGYVSIAHALATLAERPPDLVVIDVRDQTLDRRSLDALFAIGVPVIAIAGVPEINDPLLGEYPWAALLRRPVSIGEIAARVASS